MSGFISFEPVFKILRNCYTVPSVLTPLGLTHRSCDGVLATCTPPRNREGC